MNVERIYVGENMSMSRISHLEIAVVSRTQTNVEEFIKQYEREGATLVKKNF